MAEFTEDAPNRFSDSPSTSTAGFTPTRTGGRAHKRQAITRAARVVFGREGYARTSVDMIATEAAVSTRTIYKHFQDKEQLFSAVLHASATQVADGFIADVARRLTGTDPKGDLVALGRAYAAMLTDFPEHFAMVRQIEAEARHFPPATIAAWRKACPVRIHDEIARRLRQLSDQGLLRLDDPARAAVHFIALITAGLTMHGGTSLRVGEHTIDAVLAGVDAFLNGYAARPSALPTGEERPAPATGHR